MAIELQLRKDLRDARTWATSNDVVLVGRSSRCDLTFSEAEFPTVSEFHAKLTYCRGNLLVEDQGSSNGTYVNGVRAERAEARVGDEIGLGQGGPRMIVQALEPTRNITPSFRNRRWSVVALGLVAVICIATAVIQMAGKTGGSNQTSRPLEVATSPNDQLIGGNPSQLTSGVTDNFAGESPSQREKGGRDEALGPQLELDTPETIKSRREEWCARLLWLGVESEERDLKFFVGTGLLAKDDKLLTTWRVAKLIDLIHESPGELAVTVRTQAGLKSQVLRDSVRARISDTVVLDCEALEGFGSLPTPSLEAAKAYEVVGFKSGSPFERGRSTQSLDAPLRIESCKFDDPRVATLEYAEGFLVLDEQAHPVGFLVHADRSAPQFVKQDWIDLPQVLSK